MKELVNHHELLSLRVIEEIKADFEIFFNKGEYKIPLSFGEPCVVEVLSNNLAKGEIKIYKPDSKENYSSIVQSLKIKFKNPIIFHNIIPTLKELNKLFKDKEIAFLVDKIDSFAKIKNLDPRLKKLIDDGSKLLNIDIFGIKIFETGLDLAKISIVDQLDKIAKVFLTDIEAKPIWRNNNWQLHFFFSGYVSYLGKVQIPFNNVRLPAQVLPIPYASISKLLSKSPLASAKFFYENIPYQKLGEIFLTILDQLSISFNLKSNFPLLNIILDTFDEERVESKFALTGKFYLDGSIKGKVNYKDNNLNIPLQCEASIKIDKNSLIKSFPEIGIFDDQNLKTNISLTLNYDGNIEAVFKDKEKTKITISGDKLLFTIESAKFQLDPYKIEIPGKIDCVGRVKKGLIETFGIRELEIDLNWDMYGKSPILKADDKEVEILLPQLRKNKVTLVMNELGGISFKRSNGDKNLFDGRFFNALINPTKELDKIVEIFESDYFMNSLFSILNLFSKELTDYLVNIRKFILKSKEIFLKEGIKEPADIIPRKKMAKIFSLILSGKEKYTKKIIPIIKQVTMGEGLNRKKVRDIIEEIYPNHGFEFEVEKGLKWFDLLLSPMKPLPPLKIEEKLPLVEDPKYKIILNEFPSANDIYEWVDNKKNPPSNFKETILKFAPYFTINQIEYILSKLNNFEKLNYILKIKKQIKLISEGYGGVEYISQPLGIAILLWEIKRVRDSNKDMNNILGPEDVAILMLANLASIYKSRIVQLNQRILFNYISSQSHDFFKEVLIEMSWNNPRILSSILFALLDQKQSYINNPLNLVTLFSKWLNMDIPDVKDYMAGGKFARESYYEALTKKAEMILKDSEKYLAKKNHLQVYRHKLPYEKKEDKNIKHLEEEAKKAIEKADELGKKCLFYPRKKGPHSQAKQAYNKAFLKCANLLKEDKFAIHKKWFKEFWGRNYEALVVLSVVRNYQDNIDNVRYWLHKRSKKRNIKNEQKLVETVINSLYYFKEDKEKLLNDPLVRLLIPPKEGKYNFTIISAMGVVTEGEKGTELEDAYKRLYEKYGIKVIRADTATGERLEYNAVKIESAILKAKTPYGLIGYSQGCANSLMAESMLRGGTPTQQKLLENLRCRNFLFGAINGSAHGTCGNEKFVNAMIEGEKFLKYYQGIFSNRIIQLFLKSILFTLNSRFFIHLMGGIESLSHEGVIALGRDGQFLYHVPTSTVRGVVTEDVTPEALEFFSNVISKQTNGELHDTQVTLSSSVGYPNRFFNENTKELAKCDMGSLPQKTHHWSPLLKETKFITTQRDIKNAIYDFPKDRHVFPWVEVNARFGIIETL